MFKSAPSRKGMALYLVLGVLLIVSALASIVLKLMLSQSALTTHQINRIKAYYAAKAMMNYTISRLSASAWTASPSGGVIKYACLNNISGCIDCTSAAPACSDTPGPNQNEYFSFPSDPAVPLKIQIAIYPVGSNANFPTCSQLDIKVDYSTTKI